jgi:hypothetical protein
LRKNDFGNVGNDDSDDKTSEVDAGNLFDKGADEVVHKVL